MLCSQWFITTTVSNVSIRFLNKTQVTVVRQNYQITDPLKTKQNKFQINNFINSKPLFLIHSNIGLSTVFFAVFYTFTQLSNPSFLNWTDHKQCEVTQAHYKITKKTITLKPVKDSSNGSVKRVLILPVWSEMVMGILKSSSGSSILIWPDVLNMAKAPWVQFMFVHW